MNVRYKQTTLKKGAGAARGWLQLDNTLSLVIGCSPTDFTCAPRSSYSLQSETIQMCTHRSLSYIFKSTLVCYLLGQKWYNSPSTRMKKLFMCQSYPRSFLKQFFPLARGFNKMSGIHLTLNMSILYKGKSSV